MESTHIASQITGAGEKYGSVNGLIPFTAPFTHHWTLKLPSAWDANFAGLFAQMGNLGHPITGGSFDVLSGKKGINLY